MHFETSPHVTTRQHPILKAEAAAILLKQILSDLADKPEYRQFRTILKTASEAVREKAFGYNRRTTRRRILKLLSEFHCLELTDITDETRLPEREVREALDEIIASGEISRGKRRRWQEPGKHYNDIFELNSATIS